MITGVTRLAGVIGDPVRHSLSPVIHNAAFAHLGLDWVYVALPVPAGGGAAAVDAMRTLGIDGLSVTMPHKGPVAAAADELSVAAAALGVANCLQRVGGPASGDGTGDRIVGHSTDGDGFVWAFEHRFGRPPAGLSFLVAGAGGAARSIVEALGRAGAAGIAVTNRTPERAVPVAALATRARVVDPTNAEVEAADVVVNTTSLGMAGGPDPEGCPIPTAGLRADHRVVDIVYQPRRTPLLMAAEAVGAATDNGVAMLVGQAALAFELWTGVAAPIEVMTAAVEAADR
ncbi:MAG: shikimate dehydrogenase [Actinomycetota bacterium]